MVLVAIIMADDNETKHSKASRFLKKSKWGKVLKQDDSSTAVEGHQGAAAFKLNEDVVDFLKPSTEKSKPKLDIALAKRWPEAHEVRQAGQSSPFSEAPRYTKPRRRKGLVVSFVRTVPEIIGEGGDEATDPPSEISRQKAAVTRSVSDSRPPPHGEWPRSPPLPQLQQRRPPSRPPEDDFVPPPMRRANTSHNEFSPPVQRRHEHALPPKVNIEPHRPSIARTPTGLVMDEAEQLTPLEPPTALYPEQERPSSKQRLGLLDINFHPDLHQEQQVSSHLQTPQTGLGNTSGFLSPSQGLEPKSPTAQKRREMTRNEGMAFRRASMIIHNDDEDKEDSRPGSGYQQQALTAQASNTSSIGTSAPQIFSPPDSGPSPETAITPGAPNPFDDPKYTKRHSRESSPAARAQAQPATHPSRQFAQEHDRTQVPVVAPPRSPLRGMQQGAQSQVTSHHNVPILEERHTQASPPTRTAEQVESRSMGVPYDRSREQSRSPGHRDPLYENQMSPDKCAMFARPNGSSPSINHLSAKGSHSRSESRDENNAHYLQPILSASQQPGLPRPHNESPSGGSSPRSSLLGPSRAGLSPGPSPKPYGEIRAAPSPSQAQMQSKRSSAILLRHEDTSRPGSSGSYHSYRPSTSSQPPFEGNPAADAAFADFAARVAHVKGVLRLTAEREQPADRCSTLMWLRCALWWYSVGKAGLEVLLQRRDPNDPRQLLTQAHVDLAKAWWILSDPLQEYDVAEDGRRTSNSGAVIKRGLFALKNSLKMLSLSISRNNLLPPEQSLIQGQNTRIWIDYPRFISDAAAVLGGSASTSMLVEERRQIFDPYEMLPLNDTGDMFCYGRFQVDAYLNTEDSETDRVVLPCMLTVLRGKRDFQTSIVIASQNELVNIRISPQRGEQRGLSWHDVSWKASSFGMSIRLPRNFDLSIRMGERDFRAVWSLSEYARKVEKCLREEPDEKLVHRTKLAELQYADSSNPNTFPPDKVRGCSALVFERFDKVVDGSGARKVHRGYRLLLMTDAGHKTLSAVSHDVGRRSPFFFEFLTDSTANGTTAMVIRIREEKRQCRMLLVFPDGSSRQELYDVLNGLNIGPDEGIMGRVTLTSLSIEPASQSLSFSQSAHPALSDLQWQKLGVTNILSDDPNVRSARTIESEHLRIIARHSTGCITDRMNLGKGELLLRFPPIDAPCVQILRNPQEDMTISIDTRHSTQQVSGGIGQVLHTVLEQSTVRTFTFATPADLHAFETAITGFNVRFDGIASTFGISRRRMVVPIYKKWEANNVRIQIVSQGSVVLVLAFMEEFSHADALCFQIKSTDAFESGKGDNKNKKWTVKLVDAKFTLPHREKGREETEQDRIKGRFVNLEGLDYAEEHDDITIGFDTEHGMFGRRSLD